MDIIQKIKKPLIVIVIIAALYFVYTSFFKGEEVNPNVLQTSLDNNSVPPEEQEFLNLLLTIKNISIDTSVFNNPLFISLQDNGLEIVDQPHGRRNPFAPFGGAIDDSIVVTTPTPTPTPTKKVTTPR